MAVGAPGRSRSRSGSRWGERGGTPTPTSRGKKKSAPHASRSQRKDGLAPSPGTGFFFVPRTVTFLMLGCILLAYYSHAFDPFMDSYPSYANTKSGIYAVVCVFLGYSAVQGRGSSHLIRPHPTFWKVVHGVMVCYLLFMVFLLFQTVDGARQFLKHLYPELGVALDERAYGESCALVGKGGRVNWGTIRDTLFDEFVVAHTLGWWGKALILRDTSMLWVVSVAFELMELTFQHLLPNFNECWWDSWVLDVAVCNAIGIYTGMWTVRYFNGKEYDWGRGVKGVGTSSSAESTLTWVGKARRGILQFTPATYDVFEWGLGTWFRSPKRFLQCFFPAVIILLFEVNHFFLKYELWVPPRNPLNTIRLSILFLIAVPGIREYYEFIERDEVDIFRRLGVYAWTGVAIAFVETLMIVKFGRGMFDTPWPRPVLIAWGSVGLVFVVVMVAWVGAVGVNGEKKTNRAKRATTSSRR